MTSERLDIHNCRQEEILKALLTFETNMNHQALQSSGGKLFLLHPYLQLAEMKIPFSTTRVQGLNEMKTILTNLNVEDLCLTGQG